jgi:diguanylate cyclase (GGDEF)-like protein/PAS domain S-box-containing protein
VPDYRESPKTEDNLHTVETFVDPGPGFDPALGPTPAWYQAVVENMSELFIAFGHDGTVWWTNDAWEYLLGYEPGELVGRNVLTLIAPDDLDEAAVTVRNAAVVEGWRPPRPFRLVAKDGSYVTFDVAGLALFHIPEVRSIVCVARHADGQARVDQILETLAARRPLSDVLDQLVYLMHKPGWRLGVAIQYDRGDGTLAASHSDLPPALTGLDRPPGTAPWDVARSTGELVVDLGMHTIDDEVRAVAADLGFTTCWAVAVPDPGRELDACIIVWNAEAEEPETAQDRAFQRLRRLLALGLDARTQSDALEHAASTDPLTGLANRRSFEQLSTAELPDDIAVLFADLDGFKPVNDRWGHAAGDEVIRIVGRRIAASLRPDDRAARVGGDEFAILCHVSTEDEAAALAGRLVAAICEPMHLSAATVEVGMSIGVALSLGGAVDANGVRPTIGTLLELADRQLYEAKTAGRGRFALTHWSAD